MDDDFLTCFITLDDGQEYFRMQSKDAKEILGISKATFYNDNDKYKWRSEEEKGGTVFYFLPRKYVEKRWKEKQKSNSTEVKPTSPVESNGMAQQNPVEPTGPVHQAPIDSPTVGLLTETLSQLREQYEARIRQLEQSLEREREINNQLRTDKDNEINTLKGMVLLTGGKDKLNSLPGFSTVDYAPVEEKKPGILSWLGLGKK